MRPFSENSKSEEFHVQTNSNKSKQGLKDFQYYVTS